MVVQYFERSFLKNLNVFVKNFPKTDDEVRTYLHANEALLKKTRYFFKMLRYSEDQNKKVSQNLTKLIREGTKENNCKTQILYKDSLKTNFISLIEMELYLRSRYEGQLKTNKRSFDVVKPSIDLFVDSLDKQFSHEYYW